MRPRCRRGLFRSQRLSAFFVSNDSRHIITCSSEFLLFLGKIFLRETDPRRRRFTEEQIEERRSNTPR